MWRPQSRSGPWFETPGFAGLLTMRAACLLTFFLYAYNPIRVLLVEGRFMRRSEVEQPVVPQGTSPGRGPEIRSAHDAAPARTVRTRASGTPWVCRPPQLSGAAQSKGLDAGRTNAGQSPREPVGFDPARIDNSICPRPGSTVPGSENAAHDKAQPAQAWLGGAPQGARVSL